MPSMTPLRIVSLLPSATEIVCALGLGDHLVGVTHECDWPPAVRELPKVTETLIPTDAPSGAIDGLVREKMAGKRALYGLDREALAALEPDLIVTQALCDVCAVAEAEVTEAACALPGNPPVVNLEPESLEEVLESIHQVARAVDRLTGGDGADGADGTDGTDGEMAARADAVVAALRERIEAVRRRAARIDHRPRLALLEWLDPPFCSGHWNPELAAIAGAEEVLGRAGTKSRGLDWSEVVDTGPEVVLVSCCGFSVERTLEDLAALSRPSGVSAWRLLPAVESGQVWVVDGSQYFSRPGPRLVDSLEILAHVAAPDVHPLPEGLPAPVRSVDGLPLEVVS